MSGLNEHLGAHIREKTTQKIHDAGQNMSIWFPYGWGKFGAHYTKGQLRQILDETSNEELGSKGMKLRGIVAAIVLTIGTAAYNSPLGDAIQSKIHDISTISNPSK